MIYIATPYSHPSPHVRQDRWSRTVDVLATLAAYQIPCYSPVAMWHPVAERHNLPGDHVFWWAQDTTFLRACSAGWFIMFEGYRESKGMCAEAGYLNGLGKEVIYILPVNLEQQCRVHAGTHQ